MSDYVKALNEAINLANEKEVPVRIIKTPEGKYIVFVESLGSPQCGEYIRTVYPE